MHELTRCKCDFPTFDEARRDIPQLTEDAYSRTHREHHDEWASAGGGRGDYARRTGLPEPPPDLSLWDLYLRLVHLEHALHSTGFTGFEPSDIDGVLRATMAPVAKPWEA